MQRFEIRLGDACELLKTRKRLNEIYVGMTGQPIEVIERDMERDRFFSPEEAREYGLIDQVLGSSLPDLTPKKD